MAFRSSKPVGRCSLLLLLAAVLVVAPHTAAVAGMRLFAADLVPEEEMSPIQSNGRGHAEFSLDTATLRLSWKVTYAGLTSAVKTVQLFGPGQMGTNSLPFLNLGSKGVKAPVEGSAPITEAQVQYMLSTWTYISIATERYATGEIRGQLQGRVAD